MKKYLLLTTAFLSVINISYASDDQEEARPSSSQPRATPQEEIQAIIKKYAPENLSCTTFNALQTQNKVTVGHYSYSFWVPGTSATDDETTRKAFTEMLPSQLAFASNRVRALEVVSFDENIERGTVVINFRYDGAVLNKALSLFKSSPSQASYSFTVE